MSDFAAARRLEDVDPEQAVGPVPRERPATAAGVCAMPTMRLVNPFADLEAIVQENVPLRPLTWIKLGGPDRWLVQPRSIDELREAARRCWRNGIPIQVLGLGANVLVRDGGVNAAVFRLSDPAWRAVEWADGRVKVGAGFDMQKLLLRSVRQGLGGLECLAGIPGTLCAPAGMLETRTVMHPFTHIRLTDKGIRILAERSSSPSLKCSAVTSGSGWASRSSSSPSVRT